MPDKDVRRLHVAMDETTRMRGVERRGDLSQDASARGSGNLPSATSNAFRSLPSTQAIAM